jgi:O-antigen ligase
LLALPFIALLVPMEFSTGTAVRLNAVVFAIPGLAIAWLAHGALSRSLRWAPSRLDRPLVAFLVVTFTSLLRGNVMWDPAVPRAGNLLQVQLGQVTIYVLSFACFWLMAHMTQDRDWLRRVPYAFLTAVGFALFVLFFLRGTPVQRAFLPRGGLSNLTWVWAASLSLALALCDGKLKKGQKVTLLIICIAAILWPMRFQRSWLAAWLPLLVVVSVILWLSFPHLRRLMFIGLIVGAIVGTPFFLRAINWESEWETSGGSRLALWRSVIELTAQSPILGLGPAAYRHYHYLKPLTYGVTWLEPNVSAHNQFVDLFAQLGLAGLVCYIWFLVEALILAWQIYRRSKGFNKGYALAVIGALAGTFVADMVAATSLPFVYNVGFRGFRASVLGWMFLGGLVAVEKVYGLGEPTQSETAGTPARSG